MENIQISVIMSVYNGQEFIAECIESILAQTLTKFEFIIVDDASTDGTLSIIKNYALKDRRIRYVKNDVNMERSFSRNRAVSMATAELIAVMDADDVSLPDRLEKQVAFMQANPNVSVCGTALSVYDSPGTTWLPPLDDQSIKATLLFESCLYHPTVVIRKSFFEHFSYASTMIPTEDYDLWSHFAEKKEIVFANLSDSLLRYRTNEGGERNEYKLRQRKAADMVRLNLLHRIGLNPTDQEFAAHRALALREQGLTNFRLWQCLVWLKKLYKAAAISGMCDKKFLKKELISRAFQISSANQEKTIASAMRFIWSLGRVGKRMLRIAKRGHDAHSR